MLKPSQIGLISAMCLFSSVVMAKGERYGLSTSMLTIDSIKYDEGKSGEQDTLRFGLVHTRPIDENNNRWRWWLGLNYLAEDIEAPANGLYQEATNYELRVVPQYALTSWSVFTPYVGAGLSVGYSQYSNRWQVDQEGYRYESVEDIDQFELGAVVTLGTAIKLGSNPDAHIQIIPQASYILPVVNDGIGGLELSVSLLF
ncbi:MULTISPECIES: hypothetical protein [Vibrio]|jgi:opacity protein-like surface antigen|nr:MULTISPECIES: hypothetical protein [Vibrio]MDW1968484.1 hypothetical protein [Vibrio sp. 945]EGQ9109903.1 hypothetical protein [Vibrio alginolyticus]EGQ9576049.1 hypothetical protein [Vibrio alginolyticus]EGR0171597.1 hypothetical protein [Vibrio alginolyticus]EGR1560000.1 hypothetical protein [Vibrio alginolyticus]